MVSGGFDTVRSCLIWNITILEMAISVLCFLLGLVSNVPQ